MAARRKYHLVGHDGPAALFQECGDHGGPVFKASACKSGQTVPMGSQLVSVQADADGEHFSVEVIGGPPQVATGSYRSGWDATFGHGERAN